MMELWLLRHAKAEDFGETLTDRDRALSEQGLAQCTKLHQWLDRYLQLNTETSNTETSNNKTSNKAPQTIRYSPAKRTQQTIRNITEGLALPAPEPLEKLWAASTGGLVGIVQDLADAPGPIWLVGHNPGLSDFVAWLAKPLPHPGMKPGTLVRLNVDLPLHVGCGEILEVVQPIDKV